MEALHSWLQAHVGRLSAVSDPAKAMRYAIRHWPGPVVVLNDGRVEMDTNVVERAIRPHTLTRKNALFASAMSGLPLGDGDDADPDGETQRRQSDGMAHSGRTEAHELHTLLPWKWRTINNVELAEAA